MKRSSVLAVLFVLAASLPARADLASPATLRIEEITPSSFRVELILPLIKGRVPKVLPVLPAAVVPVGKPESRGGGRQVAWQWTMECEPAALLGVPIGVRGLLGTSLEVQLSIATLDGRRFEQPLRPRQPFAEIPPPPTLAQLAWDAGRIGLDRAARRPELVLLVALAVLLAMRRRSIVAALVAFGVAHAAGGALAAEGLLVSSPGVPRMLAALTAGLAALEVVLGRPWLRPGWHRPLALAMLPIGCLHGAVVGGTGGGTALSRLEARLELVFLALGAVVALALLALAAREIGAVLRDLPERVRRALRVGTGYLAGIFACAIGFYEASAPLFGTTLAPETPAVALVAAATLGLWCRARAGRSGGGMAIVALALLGAGMALPFRDVRLPLPTLVAFGGLAWLGGSLLLPALLPRWAGFAVAAVTALWVGDLAGGLIRGGTSLPPAHAVGSGVVLAFVMLAGQRACLAPVDGRIPGIARLGGAVAVGLAVILRGADLAAWLAGPVVADRAMGRLPLPVLALGLLLASLLVWPRKRRFQAEGAAAPRAAHWALLGAAFFLIPLGVWRVPNPLHDGAVPTAAAAGRVMDTLLTDTYLAFNLTDEDEAFDRLERNLAPDLVADVYLDSRRRLRSGMKEGSSVTVKGVDVVSVGDGEIAAEGSAFTYPCSWVVTARVKHRQHIHDRRNVYVGELTIRVADDRWTISRLTLTSEEREVTASWKR